MRTLRVEVVPYKDEWRADFEKIKSEIVSAVGECIIGVEHVGSTAVVGMAAKPCIDIDVVIADRAMLCRVAEGLSAIGYVHEGDLGIEGREAFCYYDKPHLAKHHLYVCAKDSRELQRHLSFRDFLRSNPDAVRQYSEVKQAAASLYPDDIEGYISSKSPYIEKVYRLLGLM